MAESAPTTGHYDYRQVSGPRPQIGADGLPLYDENRRMRMLQVIRYIKKTPSGGYESFTHTHEFSGIEFDNPRTIKPGLVTEHEYQEHVHDKILQDAARLNPIGAAAVATKYYAEKAHRALKSSDPEKPHISSDMRNPFTRDLPGADGNFRQVVLNEWVPIEPTAPAFPTVITSQGWKRPNFGPGLEPVTLERVPKSPLPKPPRFGNIDGLLDGQDDIGPAAPAQALEPKAAGKRQGAQEPPQTRSFVTNGIAGKVTAQIASALGGTYLQPYAVRAEHAAPDSREDELVKIRNTDIDRYYRERNTKGQTLADELMEIRQKKTNPRGTRGA